MIDDVRRVAITGIGAITPIGTGRAGLWAGIRAERSAVRSMTRFDPSIFRSHNAAEVDDFHPPDHIEAKRAKRLDRFGQFSVAAARLALDDAELRLEHEDRERIGAMMGTALGGVGYAEEQLGRFLTQGLRAVDATLALAVFGGAASCNIAIEFGVSGPNSTNAMSCASGAMAIGEAFRQIRHGYADVMLAGGAEAPLAPLCFGAFALIRAMSTRNDDPVHASRPFDKDRDGFVMGEGTVVLVLEAWDRAIARGAPIYAELCGYGTTNDAFHMTAPLPDGAQAARVDPPRARRRASCATRDRIHQRARQLDTAQRSERDTGDQVGLQQSRTPDPGERHQGVLRPRPRRERRDRSRYLRNGAAGGVDSPNGESRRRGPRMRPRLCAESGQKRARRTRTEQLVRFRRHQRGAGFPAGLLTG